MIPIKTYINQITGWSDTSPRIVPFDYLRVLAVWMVIITHTVQKEIAAGGIPEGAPLCAMTILSVICISCNVIYVMLSGALTLRWRQESLWSFYIRRIIHVLVPMLIYYACYVAAHTWFGQSEAQTENGYLLDFIQGKAAIAPHFWLIYVILSVYLVVPFLRSMLHSLEYAKLTALVILVVFFLAIQTFAPMQPGIELYMASWPGVAIAGYWVSQPQTRRYDRYLYGCGIVAAAVICWMVYCDMDFMQYCCNLSPVSVALGLAVFAVIFHYEKYFSVRRGWISMLGKYSYSIILIHWGILGIVASWEGLAQLQWPVRAVLVTVLTLAVSLVCSMVLDQLLVGPLMRWLERWITVKNKNENERGTV